MKDITNPFSTRFIQPGAIPFISQDIPDLQVLVDTLGESDFRGQIIGPHGSGKSSLIASLIPLIPKEPITVRISSGDSRSEIKDKLNSTIENWSNKHLLVVDGIEQLIKKEQSELINNCKTKGCGILVTSHEPIDLPLLVSVSASIRTFRSLVKRLTANAAPLVTDADIRESYNRHHPDIREALFQLYDVYETRRRKQIG